MINCLAELMCEASGIRATIQYGPPRKGDVRHSLADISAARAAFGYEPKAGMEEGLAEYMAWARMEMRG